LVKTRQNRFKQLLLSEIDPPGDIVRMEIRVEEIEELARSIEEQGLLQPIVVNDTGGRFEIIAGHRRFLAVRWLKRKTILSKIVTMDPEAVSLARASENLQRRDLTPFEEGVIYTNLALQHKMTIEDIGRRMGKSPGVVRRRQDILTMPESMQRAIHMKKISLSVAEELQGCSEKGHREYLIEMAIEHGVTKEVARMWVSDWKKSLRGGPDAGGEGDHLRGVMEPEIIYRPCDACKGPVDINVMHELRMCPECHKRIIEAIKESSNV